MECANTQEQPAHLRRSRQRGRGLGKPFAHGVSGNPNGRPKVVGEVRDLARQHTAEAVSTLVDIMQDRKQPAGARVSAAEALLDRGFGRAPQAIAIAPLPYAGEVTVTDAVEAARVYSEIMGGALALDAVHFHPAAAIAATSEHDVRSEPVATSSSGQAAEAPSTPINRQLTSPNGARDG